MDSELQREFGPQPIDEILETLEVSNHELVDASPSQLTHKQVQRARKGRRLTPNMQAKICEALGCLLEARGESRRFAVPDLFNYQP